MLTSFGWGKYDYYFMSFKFNVCFSQTNSNKKWSYLVAALQGIHTYAHPHTTQLGYQSSTWSTLPCTILAQHLQMDSIHVLDNVTGRQALTTHPSSLLKLSWGTFTITNNTFSYTAFDSIYRHDVNPLVLSTFRNKC